LNRVKSYHFVILQYAYKLIKKIKLIFNTEIKIPFTFFIEKYIFNNNKTFITVLQ